MEVIFSLDELTVLLEPFNYALISILYEYPFPIWDFAGEAARGIYRAYSRDSRTFKHVVVILTETGCSMYDSTSILGRYIVTAYDDESSILLQIDKIWEKRLIGPALELRALHLLYKGIALVILVILTDKVLCQIIAVMRLIILDENVIDIRTDCEGKV